jgi:NAD(P)-dependent dehydrogenase (short-subunit alcohol dehydrogenase family)
MACRESAVPESGEFTMNVLDKFRLNGKRVLVTGGSRGLGLAMARALAEAGADLVIVGREQEALERAASELRPIGHQVATLPADLNVLADVERMSREALARHGPIDVLVNNVGGRRINVATENLPTEDWLRILDLNLNSAFIACKIIGGAMVERKQGVIINVSSICADIVGKGIHGRTYETAKAALSHFTRCLAVDWAPSNVRCNVIAPGGFLTDPNRRWFQQMPELKHTFESQVPMGRLGEPDELGPLAVYLASDASSYMTGSVVTIDGGYTVW